MCGSCKGDEEGEEGELQCEDFVSQFEACFTGTVEFNGNVELSG